MATCKKILFVMQDGEQEWNAEFIIDENTRDLSLNHFFLPETGEEKIVIMFIRTSEVARQYAAYRNSYLPF